MLVPCWYYFLRAYPRTWFNFTIVANITTPRYDISLISYIGNTFLYDSIQLKNFQLHFSFWILPDPLFKSSLKISCNYLAIQNEFMNVDFNLTEKQDWSLIKKYIDSKQLEKINTPKFVYWILIKKATDAVLSKLDSYNLLV